MHAFTASGQTQGRPFQSSEGTSFHLASEVFTSLNERYPTHPSGFFFPMVSSPETWKIFLTWYPANTTLMAPSPGEEARAQGIRVKFSLYLTMFQIPRMISKCGYCYTILVMPGNGRWREHWGPERSWDFANDQVNSSGHCPGGWRGLCSSHPLPASTQTPWDLRCGRRGSTWLDPQSGRKAVLLVSPSPSYLPPSLLSTPTPHLRLVGRTAKWTHHTIGKQPEWIFAGNV